MKSWIVMIVAVTGLVFLAHYVIAQPADAPDRPRRGGGAPGGAPEGGRGRSMRPPMPTLMTALDANKDGKISAEEIKGAADALKKLDKNGDGELTPDELRPSGRPGGGRGGEVGPPERGDRPRRGGGADARRGGGGGADGRPGPQRLVERFMQFDKDKDGKVSKAELPADMKGLFDGPDANKDGGIDKDEVAKMFRMIAPLGREDGPGGGRRPEGGRPERGKRPEGGGRPDRGGRAERPDRPETE